MGVKTKKVNGNFKGFPMANTDKPIVSCPDTQNNLSYQSTFCSLMLSVFKSHYLKNPK